MARAVTIGNGNILVGLDYHGQVRDFYYPFVGHSNHVSGASGSFVHRVGVFVDGQLSWLSDPGWGITTGCDDTTLIGSLHAHHPELQISLSSIDAVHNEENIFMRTVTVTNQAGDDREIKVFFAQQFRISESRRGDTGLYDPRVGAIMHYKGNTTFLVNATESGRQFVDYNIGLFGIEGKEGTYKDAEDGILERNPIEHGSVDSVLGLTCHIDAGAKSVIEYWVVVGENTKEAHGLDAHVRNETVARLTHSTEKYWQAWTEKELRDLSPLSKQLQTLYRRSLTTIRVHTDNRGGIIASSDTDMLHHGRDTYGYVWPRDGALIANALDRAGYRDAAKQFFVFITDLLESGGYLMHKYRVDGVLGSSWHPWMHNGEARLPIQEDETALCLYMLWQHYERAHDLEFVESRYNTFIEPAAQFMCEYVHGLTGLPEASYDLWEEKYGMSTHTACATYGALMAATQFANLLGKDADARTYSAVAQRMRSAIVDVLYDEELGMFKKHAIENEAGDIEYDTTVDASSFYAAWYFGIFELDDPRLHRAAEVIEERLRVSGVVDGYIRYEQDGYYHLQDAESPNPWVITTLWMAQYHIKKAQTLKDLETACQLLEWTCSNATQSGVLAEQMNPHTGEHLSTAPLTWSHAEYVITVDEYLNKHAELSAATE